MNFTASDAISWLNTMNENMKMQQNHLTNLDRTIGDGDHGMNMAKGFKAVAEKLNSAAELYSVADIMKKSAIILMTTVGGASGILYATAFLRMAATFQDINVIDHTVFTKALQRAVDGLKLRGNVQYGEKTLLDVWVAMMQLFEKSAIFPTAVMIEQTARTAMEGTKVSVATKGKAALYQEASLGHIDPGAASTYYLFASLAETRKENVNE